MDSPISCLGPWNNGKIVLCKDVVDVVAIDQLVNSEGLGRLLVRNDARRSQSYGEQRRVPHGSESGVSPHTAEEVVKYMLSSTGQVGSLVKETTANGGSKLYVEGGRANSWQEECSRQ